MRVFHNCCGGFFCCTFGKHRVDVKFLGRQMQFFSGQWVGRLLPMIEPGHNKRNIHKRGILASSHPQRLRQSLPGKVPTSPCGLERKLSTHSLHHVAEAAGTAHLAHHVFHLVRRFHHLAHFTELLEKLVNFHE